MNTEIATQIASMGKPCEACDGRGQVLSLGHGEICPQCGGAGWRFALEGVRLQCRRCEGTGISHGACNWCDEMPARRYVGEMCNVVSGKCDGTIMPVGCSDCGGNIYTGKPGLGWTASESLDDWIKAVRLWTPSNPSVSPDLDLETLQQVLTADGYRVHPKLLTLRETT